MIEFIKTRFLTDILLILSVFVGFGLLSVVVAAIHYLLRSRKHESDSGMLDYLWKYIRENAYRIVIPQSISVIGYVIGAMAGNATNSIMDTLVPLIFTFIGGISTFLIVKNINEKKSWLA